MVYARLLRWTGKRGEGGKENEQSKMVKYVTVSAKTDHVRTW